MGDLKIISPIFDAAESIGTHHEKLNAYKTVKEIMSWMKGPLDNPDYRN